MGMNNNFNLVRLVLAAMVVIYHAVILTRGPSDPCAASLSLLAELGVQGFFVVSGYLVWLSLERSSSLGVYVEKRARRLVPAYASVILICAAAALLLSPEARSDLRAVGAYIGWNLLFLNFLHPDLPGVFTQNPFSEVNGALWTLKIEVMFYLVLPVLAWVLKRAGKARWVALLVLYASAEIWRASWESYAREWSSALEVSRQLPGQMSFFIVGIALACWRENFSWRSMLPVIGLILTTLSIAIPAAESVRPLGWGIVVVWLAVGFVRLPNAAAFGDLSYGLYIVHFPIIQTAMAVGLFAENWWLGAAASITSSLVAALLLWHLVEKPALRADSAYRRPTTA